jgi:hypothetical protein
MGARRSSRVIMLKTADLYRLACPLYRNSPPVPSWASTIRLRYGPQALVKGKRSATGSGVAVPHIPTGFPPLDRALGIGGLR